MAYFDSFISTNKEPNVAWKRGIQALVDSEFKNASTLYKDVMEEQSFGSLEFKNIEARITTLVDAHTGQRVNDDFKKVIFKDLSHLPLRGTRYSFDNNIWMAFSTDNIKTDTSSVYVRRCNNTLKFEDKYGNIHEEPCIIDYPENETQTSVSENLNTPSARLYVMCQLNSWTSKVDVGNRFILGSDCWLVRARKKYDRSNTYDSSTERILSFYIDYSNKNQNDNFELQMADYINYNYVVNVEKNIENVVGTNGKIFGNVTLDGKETEEKILFKSDDTNNVITLDENGNYSMLKEGQCEVIAYMKNNPSYNSVIHFSVGKFNDTPEVVPDIKVINVNDSIEYQIKYFDEDGNLIPLNIEIDPNGVSKNYYRFDILSDNKFVVKNMKSCYKTINVLYGNEKISGKYEIELGGIL